LSLSTISSEEISVFLMLSKLFFSTFFSDDFGVVEKDSKSSGFFELSKSLNSFLTLVIKDLKPG
jgi:hypothetical protein